MHSNLKHTKTTLTHRELARNHAAQRQSEAKPMERMLVSNSVRFYCYWNFRIWTSKLVNKVRTRHTPASKSRNSPTIFPSFHWMHQNETKPNGSLNNCKSIENEGKNEEISNAIKRVIGRRTHAHGLSAWNKQINKWNEASKKKTTNN